MVVMPHLEHRAFRVLITRCSLIRQHLVVHSHPVGVRPSPDTPMASRWGKNLTSSAYAELEVIPRLATLGVVAEWCGRFKNLVTPG